MDHHIVNTPAKQDQIRTKLILFTHWNLVTHKYLGK